MSTWMSSGVQGWSCARSVKYMPNSDAKNISSEPRNSTIPATMSGTGFAPRALVAGRAAVVVLTIPAYDRSASSNLRTWRDGTGGVGAGYRAFRFRADRAAKVDERRRRARSGDGRGSMAGRAG